jgi:hypothetical protein
MAELRDWLKQHGLAALAAVLAENDIDLDILPDLTDQDIERLGLSLGQRRRLLKAIATLAADSAALAATPQGSLGSRPFPTNPPRRARRSAARSLSCFAISSARPSCQALSIPRN